MSDGDLRIPGFRGSKTRPPGIPGFRESRGLRRRRSGNSGPRGSGISSIRAVVFPLSLMRQVVSAICPSLLVPDLPASLYSGILRSENRRSGGTLDLLVSGISAFRVFFFAQSPPIAPLFLFFVWLIVAAASFSPLLSASCLAKRAPASTLFHEIPRFTTHPHAVS